MESTLNNPERFIGRIWLKGQGYVTLISQGTAQNPEFLEKVPEVKVTQLF